MDTSIWDLMSHGGYAMWFIVAFSVIALAVAIERAVAQWQFTTRARSLADSAFLRALRNQRRDGTVLRAWNSC